MKNDYNRSKEEDKNDLEGNILVNERVIRRLIEVMDGECYILQKKLRFF